MRKSTATGCGGSIIARLDAQRYQAALVRALLEQGIRPRYLSSELQGIDVFALMVAVGRYDAFKIVDGETVSEMYGHCRITFGDHTEPYAFSMHSAGPFGDDIRGPWMTAEACMKALVREGLQWKDVHATNRVGASDMPFPNAVRSAVRRAVRPLRRKIHRIKQLLFGGFKARSLT